MGERVGQGAYASVRMGWRKEGGERVAVKVYDKHNLTRESRRRNVQREVHVLGKISHPHIVGFHEWFATDRHVYIVLEFVSGGSLQALLRRQPGQRFDEPQGKRLHFQVLCALQYLHARSIMHRDLKLENLLLDASGVVKVIDFGFAVVLPPAQKLKIFCGTPSYIAPEIISGQPYSLPADIWAIGVLLYVMLSGRFPFKASSQRELYRRIVRSSLQVPPELSPQAQHIVQQCLKKDDEQRPSAIALAHDPYYASVERIDERIRASTTSSASGSSLGFTTSDATTAATPTDVGLLVSKLR